MLAYVQIALKECDEREVLQQLQELQEVIEAHLLFGDWDLMVKLEIDDPEMLGTFVMQKIRSLTQVRVTNTIIVAK